MGRYWIKACVCVLLFAAFDVSAGNLPLLDAFKLRFQRYWNYNLPDLPKRTMTLPGGAKIDFVWVKEECRQGFWISKYEVTEAQWYSVMRSKPFLRSSTRAAENVSWEDCQEFCRRAGEGMRLPAEFEWTLAQKAAERFFAAVHSSSLCGIDHLRNNVWEWCEEGTCRKDSKSCCSNSKQHRSDGLGFRICCSSLYPYDRRRETVLDRALKVFFGLDVGLVLLGSVLCAVLCIIGYRWIGPRSVRDSGKECQIEDNVHAEVRFVKRQENRNEQYYLDRSDMPPEPH